MGLDDLTIKPSGQRLPSLDEILAHVDDSNVAYTMPLTTLYLCPACGEPYLYDYDARDCCETYGDADRVWRCNDCHSTFEYEEEAIDCCRPEIDVVKGYTCPNCEYCVSEDDPDEVYPWCQNCGYDNRNQV